MLEGEREEGEGARETREVSESNKHTETNKQTVEWLGRQQRRYIDRQREPDTYVK